MSISKKILTAFFAFTASVCGAAALFLMPSYSAEAAGAEPEQTLSGTAYFEISGDTLTGLSQAGRDAIGTKKTGIVIPAGVKTIGTDSATASIFGEKSPYIVEVSYEQGAEVETINTNAFNGCINLATVTIPATVETIQSNAFYGCHGVTEINYYAESAVVTSGNPFALNNDNEYTNAVTVNFGSDDYTVRQIPQALFCYVDTSNVAYKGHKGIETVNFVNVNIDSQAEWGINAFRDCTSLKNVTFAEDCNITYINNNAFYGCTALNTVSGLDSIGLETIGDSAFYNCSSLFSVTIGKEVGTIGTSAFAGCERLIEVYDLSDTLTIAKGEPENGHVAQYAFAVYTNANDQSIIDNTTYKDFSFIADEQESSTYYYLLGYTGDATTITLPDSYNGNAYKIYKRAFEYNTHLTNVTLGREINGIGDSAFVGCTALTEITFPANIAEIGTYAFQNCTSLAGVTFSGNVPRAISDGVFMGCSKLTSINLKGAGTIGYNAFKDCTLLKTVNLENTTGLTLSKIGGSAFENCAELNVINIPSTVTEVGSLAFSGCSSLKTVYLPENKNTVYSNADCFDVSEDLILITTKENYNYYWANSTNLNNYRDNLTYKVDLTLVPSSGAEQTVYRLYNKDGGYECQADTSWKKGSDLPRWEGYSRTVWYREYTSGQYRTPIYLADLTEMLRSQNADNLTLYAVYVEQPELVLGGSGVYDGNEFTVEKILAWFTGNNTADDKYIDYTVTSHYFVNDSVDSDWDGRVVDAGTYTLEVKLNTSYGVWTKNGTYQFKIIPQTKYISEQLIMWSPVGNDGTTLYPEIGSEPQFLYFYSNPAQPFLEEKPDMVQASEPRKVVNSYTLYTGKEIEIQLLWKDKEYGIIDESSYLNNKETSQGCYRAQVTINSSNNYKLEYMSVNPASEALKQLGLTFSVGTDGTVIVTKEWYIALSDANYLSMADDSGMYGIATDVNGLAWYYLDENASDRVPTRPSLAKTEYKGMASSLISFTLDRDGQHIAGNGTEASAIKLGNPTTDKEYFEYYLNSSMPAGNYVLTFYINDVFEADGTTIKVAGNHAGSVYEFTVGERALLRADVENVTRALNNDTKLPYTSAVKYQFASTDNVGLLTADVQASRVGVWATSAYADFYNKFSISYFVAAGATVIGEPPAYYPLSAFPDNAGSSAVPSMIGTYTVFYKVSAPNYSTVITGNYKLSITYTLTLDRFTIQPIEFTNSSVIEQVKMMLSDPMDLDAYDIYTLHPDDIKTPASLGSRDTYTSTGTHYVFILIKTDKEDYVIWDSAITKDNFTGAIINGTPRTFLKVGFDIVASSNSELTPLSVNNWEYGEFTWADRPSWDLMFCRDYSKYTFVLTSKTDDTKIYYFYGDPNKTLEEGQLDFNKAPAGEYILTAKAPADASGIGEYTSTVEVTIEKATPRFSTHPYIDSWNYGYEKFLENLSPDYVYGGNGEEIRNLVVFKYATEAEFNKANPTLHSKLSSLYNTSGQLSVGYYYLVFTLAETDNFASWQYGVRFRVLKGQNSWKTTPVIHDWIYGEYDASNVLNYEPMFGDKSDVVFEYRKTGSALYGWVDSVEKVSGFANGQLPVGTYEFRATLKGTVNYEDLVFQMTFNVSKQVNNSWVEVPGIKGWIKGNFTSENLPYAVAVAGNNNIKYTVIDEKGNEYVIDDINSSETRAMFNGLKVGTYTLTATIEGTDNYASLKTSVIFNVSEDSVSMTGLITATIVFAVIAVGLAVAGITLMVLNSKKEDREFRKAVKNELRRK